MADLYRVRDWNENFENADTRKLKRMRYLLLPTDLDKDAYVELIDHQSGPAHFGVWVALLELAAQGKPRGDLARSNGEPHTIYTMARLTRIPERTIETALERLCSKSVGWLELEKSPDNLPVSPGKVGDCRGFFRTDREGEGEGEEEGDGDSGVSRTRATRRPSPEAVEVAEHLRDAILIESPDHRCGKNGAHLKWAIDIDRAIRIDKRTPKALMGAIDWIYRKPEGSFWRGNVASGAKLRDKFDQLAAQARRGRNQTAGAAQRWLEGSP